MTEERITRTETADGNTHTHTTVVQDGNSKGSFGWIFAVVLLLAVGAGIWAFTQMGNAEIAKDTAIADAANQVGDAAQQAGSAIENAANEVADKN